MESRLDLFGDSANLDAREVHDLQGTYHMLRNQFGRTQRVVLTKAGRQSTLGYTHGSSLSVDGAQATNSMVTQDTDKLFIQVRPPCGRNTYVLHLIVLD